MPEGGGQAQTACHFLLDCMHIIIQDCYMVPALHLENNGVPVYVPIRDQMLQAIGSGVPAGNTHFRGVSASSVRLILPRSAG